MLCVAPVLLLRYTRLKNSIPSLATLCWATPLLLNRYYHELTLEAQANETGISFKYAKSSQTIKWESIERIEYKKSFRYEWIIIYYPYEQELLLTAYMNHYINFWEEIYYYLNKYNSSVILDEMFISRTRK